MCQTFGYNNQQQQTQQNQQQGHPGFPTTATAHANATE